MGEEASRFDLPKATRFPLQGEGQDGSEEREFLRRLGGFDLPPPNRSPQFGSRSRGLKYWLLAAPAILAIAVSIGIYTLVPALKDGNFKLAALSTESSSVTPPRCLPLGQWQVGTSQKQRHHRRPMIAPAL